jgi:hypothetical protein
MTFARTRVEKFYPHTILSVKGVYNGTSSTELFSRGNDTAKFEPTSRLKYGASGSQAVYIGGYDETNSVDMDFSILKAFANPAIIIANYGYLAHHGSHNGNRWYHGCGSDEDNLMILGGMMSSTDNTTNCQIKQFYNSMSCVVHGEMLQDRAGLSTAVNGDECIATGGTSDNISLAYTDKKLFSTNSTGTQHADLTASQRDGLAVGSDSADILAVGGGQHNLREPVSSIDNYIQKFSFSSSTAAVSFGTLAQPLVAPSWGSDGGDLVVLGGRTDGDVVLQTGVRISFTRSGTHTKWGQLVEQKAWGAACSDSVNIMISGGSSNTSPSSAYITENCERISFADEASATNFGTIGFKYIDHSGAPGG